MVGGSILGVVDVTSGREALKDEGVLPPLDPELELTASTGGARVVGGWGRGVMGMVGEGRVSTTISQAGERIGQAGASMRTEGRTPGPT